MKITKGKIIGAVIIAVVLAAVFRWGGNAPGLQGWSVSNPQPVQTVENSVNELADTALEKTNEPAEEQEKQTDVAVTEKPEASPEPSFENNKVNQQTAEAVKPAEEKGEAPSGSPRSEVIKKPQNTGIRESENEEKKKSKLIEMYDSSKQTAEGVPKPQEPENAVITDKEMSCTLSVRCDNILKNMEWLNPEKRELVPKDGIIFAEKKVTFYEGESVFNVLLREMKRNKIHMEYVNTPIYNSAYIEGINNLYEFDCGELSGWIYKVNGKKPDYGCSRYPLSDGDRIEFIYTCSLGNDV